MTRVLWKTKNSKQLFPSFFTSLPQNSGYPTIRRRNVYLSPYNREKKTHRLIGQLSMTKFYVHECGTSQFEIPPRGQVISSLPGSCESVLARVRIRIAPVIWTKIYFNIPYSVGSCDSRAKVIYDTLSRCLDHCSWCLILWIPVPLTHPVIFQKNLKNIYDQCA